MTEVGQVPTLEELAATTTTRKGSGESMADALAPFLRECGIEVTDGG